MIIQNVELNKRLFFSDRVLINTDKKRIFFETEWSENLVNEINRKLSNFKIESGNDFVMLRRRLGNLDEKKYFTIENAIFSSIENKWRFFNPSAFQVPRPLSVVYRKNKGVNEYIVFSLNAKNFFVALDANRHVADKLKKKLENTENPDEKDVLITLKEAADEEHKLIDFELRFGVAFNNYRNGKYVYNNKSLSPEEHFNFVCKLIEEYNLVYIENPFFEGDIKLYKKLTDRFRKKGIICMNSKINDYTKGLNNRAFNGAVLKFENLANMKSDAENFIDEKINLIVEGVDDAMDAAVGLGIPLVKITDDRTGNAAADRLNRISEEILKSRQKK